MDDFEHVTNEEMRNLLRNYPPKHDRKVIEKMMNETHKALSEDERNSLLTDDVVTRKAQIFAEATKQWHNKQNWGVWYNLRSFWRT
jgi:hypothetical protein